MIRLFAFDMDGTCLDTFKRISQRNLLALEYLSACGVICVPASGRALSNLPQPVQNHLLFPYVITSNGSHLYDMGQDRLLYQRELSENTVENIRNICRKYPVITSLQADGETDSEQPPSSGIEKITLYYLFPPVKNKVITALKDQMNLQISGRFIYSEITAQNAAKGIALKALQERLKILPEETACIGDAENDESMFETCAIRFAPQNACRKIRQSADYIVPDCDHDAVWHAVKILMKSDELKNTD